MNQNILENFSYVMERQVNEIQTEMNGRLESYKRFKLKYDEKNLPYNYHGRAIKDHKNFSDIVNDNCLFFDNDFILYENDTELYRAIKEQNIYLCAKYQKIHFEDCEKRMQYESPVLSVVEDDILTTFNSRNAHINLIKNVFFDLNSWTQCSFNVLVDIMNAMNVKSLTCFSAKSEKSHYCDFQLEYPRRPTNRINFVSAMGAKPISKLTPFSLKDYAGLTIVKNIKR